MSDAKSTAAAQTEIAGLPPIHLQIDGATAVAMIGALQLACRHPGFRLMKTAQLVEHAARAMQAQISPVAPELGRVLEKGWHSCFDVDATKPGPGKE